VPENHVLMPSSDVSASHTSARQRAVGDPGGSDSPAGSAGVTSAR
jgi:hypothetical protein